MHRQIEGLTPVDLALHSAWYFPMDEMVEDELSVVPVESEADLDDYQVIVSTQFVDGLGRGFKGYIYWGRPESVDYLKPTMFLDGTDIDRLYFWRGIMKPSSGDIRSVERNLQPSHSRLGSRAWILSDWPV